MSTGAVSLSTTPLIAGDTNFTASLSPDALMVYVQTRLNGLDAQVDSVFNDQKRQQAAQEHLHNLNNLLSEKDENAPAGTGLDPYKAPPPIVADPDKPGDLKQKEEPAASQSTESFKDKINKEVEALKRLDPSLGAKIESTLQEDGQILAGGPTDNTYSGPEVKATKQFLEDIGKDLESQAALNMIRLQSIMSSRQTAVQLATNMVSNLGETTKSIVTNIGH